LALLAVAFGIPAATLVARAAGKKDPQFVVIDETAGQLITLIAAPIAWKSLLAAFILFRAFDIAEAAADSPAGASAGGNWNCGG